MNDSDAPTDHSADEPGMDAAQPYRTPAEVSEQSVAAGWVRSKKTWFGLVALVGLAGAAAYAMLAPQQDYIQNFGDIRRGPVEIDVLQEEELAAYEAEMEAQSNVTQAPSPQ
ncbi:MAG: hypothetical protein HKN47_26310 [Pirellulaceae bacterium]|nr:hypothetical protein [Pirellulaceae bacterium]